MKALRIAMRVIAETVMRIVIRRITDEEEETVED